MWLIETHVTLTDIEQLCDQFLVRPPRKGGLPIEKMDLMNTVNQLLLENGKLKDEKVTLEEEVKLQRRTNAKERVKGTVTSRDVALCANNKVSFICTSCYKGRRW
jgi:hypothetical protein